ncbi:MAG: two component transcriptional regulator, AraC family [Eubacterium sp.]|jgi:two-component system response regulator YesN|nr:two component transcriptional regulator, AraC family [Eubacterium sp.]
MLSVIIIDDEDYIREGLKKIINWNQYGFCICGEAVNGLRGLSLIRELKPDLVVVDIKMPKMDGLEMIKELRKDNEVCEFIVLSAYSEFKYAQTAIELDIDSYILKPIEQPVLIEKICKVHDKITNKRQAKQNVDMSINFSRDKILQSIIHDQIDSKILEKYCLLYGFDFPWSSYRVALIEIEGNHMEMMTIKMSVKRHIERIITENNLGYVFDIENYIGILLYNVKITPDLRILHDLPVKINGLCKTDVTVLLGSVAEKLTDIPSSYQNACKLLNRKFTMGYKRVISDVTEETKDAYKCRNARQKYVVEHIVDSLCNAVDAENMEKINNILEGLFQEFLSEECIEDIIKINYSNIYSATLNKLCLVNPGMKEKLIVKQEILTEICKKSSLQELHGYMKYIFTSIADEIEAERPADPIAKILEYIERNYSQDLKLETLAILFNYNRDYLGKKIKDKTGKHFNTYLDSIRFEKAKQLLSEGQKVYQAAEKTGFKDINYFYKKFKIYVGVSPSDYKDKALKE